MLNDVGPNIASIIIAVVGGAFGIWSSIVSSKNKKETKTITEVLSNTKSPVDSLDQVISLLQGELRETNKRREIERKFFTEEINRLKLENEQDRKTARKNEERMQDEIDNLVEERTGWLKEIAELRDQVGSLEKRVRKSLELSNSGKITPTGD